MSKKVAIVLFNLGGPDSQKSIEPFLMNFFMDKNIISLPLPFRFLLAKFISNIRSKNKAKHTYSEIGNKSPLLENSMAQGNALEQILNTSNSDNTYTYTYKVYVSMRYWHPMADKVVKDIHYWQADKVILLPLYPQFSTTTTYSSLESWKNAIKKTKYRPETSMICCYPENDGFINVSANNIYEQYKRANNDGHENPRIIFSAHGLPEKIINGGDPYQYQCEKGAEKIATVLAKKLNIDNLDWQICYQSRVGRLKWIGPSLDEALNSAAADNKAVIIYPHAFTQEHAETLVELDIEYKKIANLKGVNGYYRSAVVGIKEEFINGLADLVKNHLEKKEISAENGKCYCPDKFNRCLMRTGNL